MTAIAFFSNSTLWFVILGLATGALYALVALGIVLVYRASGILNFAAGAVGAVAAFVYFDLIASGWPWWAATIVGLLLGALLGMATHLVVMRILRRVSLVAKLIATLGIMAVATGLIGVIWRPGTRRYPPPLLPGEVVYLTDDFTVPTGRFVIIGIVLALAVALRLVYSKTLFGLATSGVAENRRVAAASGWSPTRIELVNFAVAGALSAGAAILLAPLIGLNADILSFMVLPSLAAALVGRLSSFGLTVFGAMGIAVLSAELGLFRNDLARELGVTVDALSGLSEVVPLLIIVLVTVSSGRARLQRGESSARLPRPGRGRVSPIRLALGLVALAVGVALLGADWSSALTAAFAAATLVLSVVVVTGYCGQLSLCQFALAGIGCLVAARLMAEQDFPFELALASGILVAVPVGFVVALPALRTRGVNLAVVTLSLAFMVSAVVFNNRELAGFGGATIRDLSFLGIDLDPVFHGQRYTVFTIVMFLFTALLVSNLRRGRSGRRLLAVRSNERAAASLGIGVYGAKLYAFGLGSAIAALSGILLGFRLTIVSFGQFDPFGSTTAVLNSVIGGVGWASGAIVGGLQSPGSLTTKILGELFPQSIYVGTAVLLTSGLGVIAVLAFSPDGLVAWVSDRLPPARWLRIDRASRAPAAPEPAHDRPPAELRVEGLTVRFGGVVALDDVTFDVHPGEVVGLIGPNGAGKTTALDVITGFTRPQHGSVVLDGRPVQHWSPERRARAGIARSWQSVELFEEMTVRDNLLVAVDRHSPRRYFTDLVAPGRTRTSVQMDEVVAELELEPYLDVAPSALSQGAARLVGIARAIASEPAVLLLDEPAAGLDRHESEELGLVIREVAERRGIGVLVVEHDVALLMDICDRIVVLDFGRLIAEGTPEEIRNHPEVIRAYLGTPAPV